MTDGRRPRRVAETIRKYIAEVFGSKLYDPRLAGLMVTRVDIGADLSNARVQVRALVPLKDEAARRDIEKAANRAATSLRRELGAQLGLKKTPSLSFHYDSDQDALDHVEALLGEIRDSTPPTK